MEVRRLIEPDVREHYGFVKRWGGLRLVAVDASTVRFGIGASRVKHAALAAQILFAMSLLQNCLIQR